MKCDEGCGECCGPVFVSQKEYREIKQYIRGHGIVLRKNSGLECILYQNGKCQIYSVRPVLCRIFGHTERLNCSRGYNVNLPDRKIRRLLKQHVNPEQARRLNTLLIEEFIT